MNSFQLDSDFNFNFLPNNITIQNNVEYVLFRNKRTPSRSEMKVIVNIPKTYLHFTRRLSSNYMKITRKMARKLNNFHEHISTNKPHTNKRSRRKSYIAITYYKSPAIKDSIWTQSLLIKLIWNFPKISLLLYGSRSSTKFRISF